MNEMIELLQNHVSVRDYANRLVSEEIKNELVKSAQSASTSNFVQAYSIIEMKDPKVKDELAEITQFSGHLAKAPVVYVFVADLYRHAVQLKKNDVPLDGLRNMESMVVSMVDATLAAQNMAIAAESFDLGICYIGGIRNDLYRVKELLHLPELTVPLFAMTIGYPASKNDIKPRMPLENVLATDTYQTSLTDLTNYDEQIRSYYQNRNNQQADTTWTQKNVDFFSIVRRPEFAQFLLDQGFTLK